MEGTMEGTAGGGRALPGGAPSAALAEVAAALAADPWLRERGAAVVCEEQRDVETRVRSALGAAGGLLLTVALDRVEGFRPSAMCAVSVTAVELAGPNRGRPGPFASALGAAWRAAEVLDGPDWMFDRLESGAREGGGGGLEFSATATFRGYLGARSGEEE